MKRGNQEVEPNSSPETYAQAEKTLRRFSPLQPQVTPFLTPVVASAPEMNMDQHVLEQTLSGAPEWAVNMTKLLMAQIL